MKSNFPLVSMMLALLFLQCNEENNKIPVHDVSVPVPITDWILLGPFETGIIPPNRDGVSRFGHLTDFLSSLGGEANAILSEETEVHYDKRNGRSRIVRARRVAPHLDDSLRPEFNHILYDTHVLERDFDRAVGYAFCYLKSERGQEVYAYLGTDGSPKVWCNGSKVFEHWADFSKTKPWQYQFKLALREGYNPLLIKIDNWEYWWGLQMEVFTESTHAAHAFSRVKGLALDSISVMDGTVALRLLPAPEVIGLRAKVQVGLYDKDGREIDAVDGITGEVSVLADSRQALGEAVLRARLDDDRLTVARPFEKRLYIGNMEAEGHKVAAVLNSTAIPDEWNAAKMEIFDRIVAHYEHVLSTGVDPLSPVDMTNLADARRLADALARGRDVLSEAPMAAWPFLFQATDCNGDLRTSWSYITLPRGYFQQTQVYPLVIELHGSGQFGKNIAFRENSYARIPAEGEPVILVNPISPGDFRSYDGATWDPVLLDDYLAQLKAFLRIDDQRVYLEGASGGGKGAWAWAFNSPQHFAAMIVLVGGEGYPFRAEKLRNMPIMILNGELDRASYPFLPELMVQALRRVDNEPVYVNYPDRGHTLIGKYKPEILKRWLLKHWGAVVPGDDPLHAWQVDAHGISQLDIVQVPASVVFGLTEKEDPPYPQDNLYRSAAKLYRAYRKTRGVAADRMADGIAFIHTTEDPLHQRERMLLLAPLFEDLGTNGDLCLVETGPMKAARFYAVTEREWSGLREKKQKMYEKVAAAGYTATGEEHSRLLTIMDADKRYWEVYIGIE